VKKFLCKFYAKQVTAEFNLNNPVIETGFVEILPVKIYERGGNSMTKDIPRNKQFTAWVQIAVICIMGIMLFSLAGNSAFAQTSSNSGSQGSAPPKLTASQLDKIVAPIALYPDALVAQILPASTLSIQVVEADRYLKKNGGKADSNPPNNWDPSVLALLSFPEVIAKMDDNLDWTQQLGDAVIAQPDDVFAAIQRVRKIAYDNKSLQTTQYQTVSTDKQTIVIQPSDPEVIYVPQYDPNQVVSTQTYNPAVPLLTFAAGIAVSNWSQANTVDWYGRNIIVNPNYRYGPIATPYNKGYARGYINGATNPYPWKPSPVARNNYNNRYHVGNANTYHNKVNNVNVNKVNNVNVNKLNKVDVNKYNKIDANKVNKANVNNVTREKINNVKPNNVNRPVVDSTKRANVNRDAFSGMSHGAASRDFGNRGASSVSNRASVSRPAGNRPAGGGVHRRR
jgi:hypothetical protein